MSQTKSAPEPDTNSSTLVICDAGGRVQAVSSKASSDLLPCAKVKGIHFSEVFGQASEITRWLTEHINLARRQGDYMAESRFEGKQGSLIVKLESLKCDGEPYGFAVQILHDRPPQQESALTEGTTVVTRQQWHDIKNQLGGLKLYATFLSRKMATGADHETIEKLLNSVNMLIENLAKIRRGEGQ
jgi:nitrogen-specific signal transduction histidine kinase